MSAYSAGFNGIVEFENFETGQKTVLQDTVVRFSGNFTHNFILNENLEPRKSYQITVTRPDGNFVTSTATMPGSTRHSIEPLEDAECVAGLQIRFQNVLPSEQIRLEAGFSYDGIRRQEVTRYCELERDGNDLILNISTLQMLGIVFPAPNTDVISCRETNSSISCNQLNSNVVQLRYYHLGPEWNRVFPIYPNDPEDVEDVNNGLGFLGGYRNDTMSYTLSLGQSD